jgi:hypothetical protein
VVREGNLLESSCAWISVLSPLDRFRLEDAGLCDGVLLSGSADGLAEERVERRGGMCMRLRLDAGVEGGATRDVERRVMSRVCHMSLA